MSTSCCGVDTGFEGSPSTTGTGVREVGSHCAAGGGGGGACCVTDDCRFIEPGGGELLSKWRAFAKNGTFPVNNINENDKET